MTRLTRFDSDMEVGPFREQHSLRPGIQPVLGGMPDEEMPVMSSVL